MTVFPQKGLIKGIIGANEGEEVDGTNLSKDYILDQKIDYN